MAREQFIDRGLTVANAVGNKAVDAGTSVAPFVADNAGYAMLATFFVVLPVVAVGVEVSARVKRSRAKNNHEIGNKEP